VPACLANASCCEIGIAALFVCCLFGALIVHATALRFVGFGSMPGVGGQNSSSLRRAWVLTKLRVGLIEPYRLPKSLLRIDRCLGPYFARSASPQCMSLIVVLGTQPASIAKRMESSKSLTRSLRTAALRTTSVRNGKLRCTSEGENEGGGMARY